MLDFNLILNITIKILVSILLIVGIYVFIQFSNKKLENEDKIRFNKFKILRIVLYGLSVFFINFKDNFSYIFGISCYCVYFKSIYEVF